MLKLNDLHVYYGNIHALKGVSLCVEKGEIVTLIGANGAGKTTTLQAISGLLRPKKGEILFDGQDMTRAGTAEIVQAGIVQSPEGRKLFAEMTVEENLLMGAYTRCNRQEIQHDLEWVCTLFPILKERRRQRAGSLSGGEQQMCSIARALMSKPKLLLLDEPSLGLAPILVQEIFRVMMQLNEEGATILVVEQNAAQALKIAHRGYVMETGTIVMSGKADELLHDERVRKAYLGG